jgi:Glycosyltransferase family 87
MATQALSSDPRTGHHADRFAARAAADRRRTVAVGALFAILAAAIAFRTALRLTGRALPLVDAWGLQDFNDAVYQPVVAFLAGENPYDASFAQHWPVRYPFPLYLPATLLLHLPLGFLPFPAAGALYYLVAVALVPVLAMLALRMAGVPQTARAVLGVSSLVLLSRPGSWTLFIGQYTVTMAVATCVAFLWAREQPWLAALGVALAALKPTFGAPLAILLLARGDWRAVVRGLGIAGVLSAVAALPLVRAAGGLGPFIESLATNYASFGQMEQVNPVLSTYRIDAASLVGRLLGGPLPGAAEQALLALVLGVAAAGVRRLAADPEVEPAARLSATLALVAILVCTYHQAYDALLLAAPLVALATPGWAPARLVTPRRRALLTGLLAVPTANYLCTQAAATWLGLQGPWLLVNLSVNAVVLLAALGLLASLALRPIPRAAAPRVPATDWTLEVTEPEASRRRA